MAKFITEIFENINNNIETASQYTNNAAVKVLLKHAFLPEAKFILPEGAPPYKPDAAPQGMSMSNMYQEIRRLYIFLRADLTAMKREQLFISMLEGLHPSEAELLLLIKDQNLTSKYPNITKDSVGILLK